MKIKLVEDSPQKVEAIESFIKKTYQDASLSISFSFNSGLKSIIKDLPSLVILDMTLPTYDKNPGVREGRNRQLGGYEIMRKLKLKKIDTKIIVLTQLDHFGEGSEQISFENLKTMCESEFKENFIGIIRYKHGNEFWKDELSVMINQVK